MEKIRVLFVCIHNSARSQMAEEFLTSLGGDKFIVESAGFKATGINPLVVKAMAEIGSDVSQKDSKSVYDLILAGRSYDYVITVCDESIGQHCPVFPGRCQRLHWSFTDPADLPGNDEERLSGVREIRDHIFEKIAFWLKSLGR